MCIRDRLLSQQLELHAYFAIPVYGSIFLLLFGNLTLTVSILTERITTFISITIILFFFMIFGTGILFEFEFYPRMLGMILSYNPFSLIVSELRGLVFLKQINWVWIMIPVLTGLGWTWINGLLIKRSLKQ